MTAVAMNEAIIFFIRYRYQYSDAIKGAPGSKVPGSLAKWPTLGTALFWYHYTVGRGAALLTCLLAASTSWASAPEALKIEPPGWWAKHSINPVRLLIGGRGLAGAQIESAASDLTVGPATINASGTYLFVDVRISRDAKPGARALTLKTPGGQAEVPFEVLEPLPRKERFSGFSPDDVVYLVMPDRFANGDPSNDDGPKSRGLHDRSSLRFYHGGDLQGIMDHLGYLTWA